MKSLFVLVGVLATAVLLPSCEKPQVTVERESGFEKFTENYNRMIAEWLLEQSAEVEKTQKELEEKLAKATTGAEKKSAEGALKDLDRRRKKIAYRQTHDGFFSFKTEADIPSDLVWKNGMDNPIIGDPKAKKGGTFYTYIPAFPDTLRPIGPNANNSFRGEIYDNIDLATVGVHPLTKKFVPSLAKEWALGKDGRTVFFRVDPDATYNDGVKVKAKDFMFYLYVRLSDNVFAPFQKQYFKEQFANVTTYSEDTFSVSLPEPKPMLPFYCSLSAAPPHFYAEYGPDYEERYQWRIPPTTGAYTVLPEDIKKGRSITLTRVKDWWAKDKKFSKYSNNADKIHYQVIADRSKAFELFLLGKIDTFYLTSPDYWYDKMEVPQYFKGYIEKVQFYNVYPRVPRGFYLNLYQKPLDDRNVRLGLAHSMNFSKVNTVLYRGDLERLNHFSEGFGQFTHPDLKAREYSVSKAAEYFAKAGFTERDSEGYFVDQTGKRLSIELTWGKGVRADFDQMMDKLKEDAKKAGVELTLDGQQSTVYFRKMLEKRHKMGFLGWGSTPPFPRYYQFFHSKNAYDEKGNVKQQTNNMNSYTNPEMDKLCEIVRGAKTEEELRDAAWKIQQMVHDEGLFIPALKTSYVRMANWRWIKWPQTKLYEFCAPTVREPTASYLYWIDDEVKEETLDAKAKGIDLPEVNHFYDLYRKGIPTIEELENRTLKTN